MWEWVERDSCVFFGAVVLGVSGIGIWSLGVTIMVVYSGELE